MNILLVIAHPYVGSFNHAIKDELVKGFAASGHDVKVRDLYAEGFDPVLGSPELEALNQGVVSAAVQQEQADVSWADGLVFLYPLWWYDRPAILKGWCDRVLTYDFAFTYDETGQKGLLKHQKAAVIITAGASEQELADIDVTEAQVLFPMTKGTLRFCGIEQVEGRLLYAVSSVSQEAREQMLSGMFEFARDF